ncbi:DUF3789 domain-containing protein [Geoalkalibacter halelectricus]
MTALWCVAAFVFGALFGVVVMCLCFIAKEADRGQS